MKKEFQFGEALHEVTNKKRKKMRGIVNHAAADSDRYNSILESPEYAEEYNKLVKRVLPLIDVKNPETFAFYGSAEKYYENSYSYIYGSYPYDGSALEKVKWSLSASVLDLAVLQHEYPKEVGLVNLSPTGWGTVSSTAGNYGLPAIPEYIKFSGGPYVGTRLDSATNRESGLKLDPSAGNTVEFWLKKGSYASTKTGREVITDIGTSDYAEGSSSYGRFLVEMSTSAGSANPILLTYMSGTAGFDGAQFTLSDITKETIADDSYHHYAITVYSSGSNLVAELYFDGEYDSTISTVGTLGAVQGYFNGTIGALSQAKDGNGVIGSGKAIGSIDDFRFWKEKRTPEQIGIYYDSPVNGATDKENINNILGVYYKFNEGTTDNTSQDKIILDYSGRVNNGEFIGYNTDSRSNVSAITLTSTTTEREIGDPIINSTSSRVVTQLAKLTNVGRAYDRYNNSSLFKSVPQWAYDTPAGSNNLESDFSILIQAMASQFDSIRLLINDIPKISFPQYRDFFYASGSADYSQNFTSLLGCEKDFTNTYNTFGGEEKYVIQNLVGRGFDVTDLPIVSRSSLDEFFHNLKFEKIDQKTLVAPALIYSKADTIKNKILNSVYVNLQSIYGTKGTTSSFRNLIRCFGVDEKLIAPNVYANNAEKEIKNEAVSHDIEIKSISFQDLNREVTLHQAADTAEERDYIAGRPSGPMTFETTAYFPYITPSTSTATTANIFGVRGVSGADLATTVANYPGFVVQSIKSATINPGAYFKLSSKPGIFADLTTSYFNEVYANKPWHLAVRFSEDTDNPLYSTNNRTNKTYRVEFSGYQYELDVLTAQFNMSTSISSANYQNFITSNKSVFAGAERTNIVGSVQTISDLKNISLSVWDDRLETEEIKEHAKAIDTIGRTLVMSKKDSNEGSSVLRGDSLILNWQFDDVTYNSDTIQIEDHASGSAESLSRYGSITGYKYPAVTTTTPDMTGIIQQEFLSALKYVNIDNFYSKSKVEIKDREIESFQLDSRPVSSLYTYEKSMYQVLSAEMLKMLAGAVAFNNLIGQPVYKYRQEYKSLEKLRERFFSKVEGKVDLEKFIEYYKWIDSSLGKMLQQLQPATAEMNLGLEDVVESHALERNKYQHKTPNFEFKDPKIEGQILAVNELLYDWEHGHAPFPLPAAAAAGSVSIDGGMLANLDNASFTIISTDDTSRQYIFDKDAAPDGTGPTVKIQGLGSDKAAIGAQLALAINHSGGHDGKIVAVSNGAIAGPTITLTQTATGPGGNTTISSSDPSSGGLTIASQFAGGFDRGSIESMPENKNCLWWSDRAERDGILSVSSDIDSDRETQRIRRSSVVSGSTYALRRLSRPYNLTSARLPVIDVGSNRNASKNKSFYKIINSGHEIKLNKSDIYEFKKCSDVLNPQKENIYTAKTNTTNTEGYLDADADMILPFSLYSSSAGQDFSDFKSNLSITNNHDDERGSLQGPFARDNVGGMPHRRVRLGAVYKDRPEAYILSATAETLTLKENKGPFVGPRSTVSRGLQRPYNIANINTDLTSGLAGREGNYEKDYEIVMTTGRRLNNGYLADSGSIITDPISTSQIGGLIDFTTPVRGRREHVIVNQFSSPGGPETQGAYGRDKESAEYSVYNTLNYRNLSIRNPLNLLEKERALTQGYRSGSTTQASMHMTNRNYFYSTSSTAQVSKADNAFIQHPIPQNDFGYSWIAASATNTKFDFINKNAGFGHQHMLGASASVGFSSAGATTTITFTDSNTAPSNGEQITIISTDGTSVTYTAQSAGSLMSATVFSAPTSGLSPGAASAASLVSQIIRQYGFPSDLYGKVHAVYEAISPTDIRVHLTQLSPGADGNTTITSNLSNVTAPGAFTSGVDAGFTSHKSETSINFLSASIFGSFYYNFESNPPPFSGRMFGTEEPMLAAQTLYLVTFSDFIPVDFAGLNINVYEPINQDTNTLGNISFVLSGTDDQYPTIVSSNYINQFFVKGADAFADEEGVHDETWVGASFGRHGVASTLNSIILNRQGPYGWPSWKQLRGGEHPIVRAHRRSSTFSRVYEGDLSTGAIMASQRAPSMNYGASRLPTISDAYERSLLLNNNDKYAAGTSTGRIIKNYIDPIATNRFCPISITIHGVHAPTSPLGSDSMEWTRGQDPRLPHFYKERENVRKLKETQRELAWNLDHYYYEYLTQVAEAGREDVNLEHLGQYLPAFGNVNIRKTYQNDLTSYANMEIAEDTNHNEIKHHDFIPFMKNIIAENMLGQNKLLEISYIEKIYPREESTYKKSVREREKFDFHGWKSSRSSRKNILVGNITYSNSALLNSTDLQAFKGASAVNQSDYRSSFLGSFDAVDHHGIVSTAVPAEHWPSALGTLLHITASTWSLDGRSDFTQRPAEIGNSYFNSGSSALTSRDQGTRGEGILQNDFSTFPLGYNSLHGTPPFSLVYNRRIPQTVGAPRSADLSRNSRAPTYLAGEAKWEAASSSLGPFYDSYEKYSEDIKFIAQDHSLVPEFRISEFAEDILTGERGYPNIGDDYLAITGAIYQNSSGEVEAGGQFFKTYSNSDFLKYFSVVDEELREGQYPISHARMTLKCKAAMKFLPYRGFYPAERSVQLAELFQRNYLGANTLTSEHIQVDKASDIPENDVREYVKLRANASRFNAGKAFFGPGILYNSIKSGVAVDYPIFQTHLTSALTELPETVPIQSYTNLYIHATSSFTGSLINGTVDGGIPRLKSNVTKRISFEDVLNPVNIYDTEMHDNEPHPSASLLYGTTAWNKIIERPSLFGKFNEKDLESRLGAKFTNPRNAFAAQISPYTLAVQNFAAETANFFLEDGHLTTAMSKPVKEFFKTGQTYTMRTHITNVDTTMYDRHSAFGPPVDDGHGGVALTVLTPATNLDLPAPIGARADTTFGNPSGYDLSSVTGSEHMPKLVLTSDTGAESTFAFYDSDNSKGSFSHLNTPKFNYIDTKTSAPDIADQFYSRLKKINDDDRGYKPSSFSSASVGVLSTTLGPSGSVSSIRTDFGIAAETSTFYCIGQNPQTSGSVFGTTSPNKNMELHDPAGWVPWLMQATEIAQLPSIQYTVGSTTHTFKFYATSSINTPSASNTTFITASLRADSRDTAAVNLCHSINTVSGFGITATAGTSGRGEINTVLVGTSTGVVPTLSNGSVPATPVFIFDEIMNNHNIQLTGGVVAHTASYVTTQTTSVTEHGFAPYVPPFLDKNADPYVEISFAPSASRVYGAKEIIENSTFTYHNFHAAPSNAGTNQNYINSMSLSASLNLGICVKLETDNVETVLHGSGYLSNDNQPTEVGLPVAPVRIDPNHDFYRWVIQTKWETPVLDFANVTASALTIAGDVLPVSGSPWKTRTWDAYYHRGQENSAATAGSFITGSIGMWHQKGTFPGMDNTNAGTNKNKGYFLNIVDVPTADGSQGLANKLGFSIDREKNINQRGIKEAKLYRQRIGAIEDKKVIKEAIVAIPYVIRTDLRNEIQFVEFNEDFYDKAKNTVAAIKKEIRDVSISDRINTIEEYERLRAKYAVRTGNLISDSPVNAIEYQLFMMEEYILPPDLDFLMSGKTPYMMYFFQFKASLGKDDLGNMWQNLYPSSADSTATARYSYTNKSFEGRFGFENDVSYVSHYLDTLSLMGDSLSPVENPRNLFSPLDKNQNTRWMIFKVKQRGLTSLEEVRKRSIDPRTSNIQEMEYLKGSQSSLSQGSLYSGLPGRGRPINKLQFNWPYDYFSFVELVKLETKIDSYNHIPPGPEIEE